MPEPSQPPPGKTFVAAAAGGFGGALLGVIAATAMTGDGDAQVDVQAQETKAEIVETRVASR